MFNTNMYSGAWVGINSSTHSNTVTWVLTVTFPQVSNNTNNIIYTHLRKCTEIIHLILHLDCNHDGNFQIVLHGYLKYVYTLFSNRLTNGNDLSLIWHLTCQFPLLVTLCFLIGLFERSVCLWLQQIDLWSECPVACCATRTRFSLLTTCSCCNCTVCCKQ